MVFVLRGVEFGYERTQIKIAREVRNRPIDRRNEVFEWFCRKWPLGDVQRRRKGKEKFSLLSLDGEVIVGSSRV